MGFNTSAIRFFLATKSEFALNPKTLVVGHQTFRPSLFLLFALKKSGLIQKSKNVSYVDDFLKCSGIETIDFLDFSPYEGANILHDLSKPVPIELRNVYDLVIEAGTIEHIPDLLTALSNVKSLVKPGGHLLIVAPGNNFLGHGCYQLSPEIFHRALSLDQGFNIEYLAVHEESIFGGRWRRVPDSKKVNKRIDIVTRKPTYICILAKKTEEITVKVGHQSDYEAIWNNEVNASRLGSLYLKSPYAIQRITEVLLLQFKHRREMRKLLEKLSVRGILRLPNVQNHTLR